MTPRRLISVGLVLWALTIGYSVHAPQAAAPAAAQTPAQTPESAPAAPPANSDCFMCHEDDSAARADGTGIVVKPGVFEKSVHGGFSCVDCHTDTAASGIPHPEKLAKVDCATCHGEAVEKYRASVHAKAHAGGITDAATCVSCHGSHDILAGRDPQSRTHRLNIAATCSRCHGDAVLAQKAGMPADLAQAFADSIHGQAMTRRGLTVAPTCSDCHAAHDTRDTQDPASPVAGGNVAATCGKCHEGVSNKFKAGVHGSVLAKGDNGAPACQTCHTPHAITRTDSTAWQLSVIGQCGTCHADRVATFKDTFHGQVTSLGFRAVAGCADCHGAHEVLPASDPRSPIAPANLVTTCGRCHEGANANFVKYDPHADKHNRERSPALYYVSKFMNLLLAGVFTFFGIHTSLWFTREIRLLRERRASAPPPSRPQAVAGKEATPTGESRGGDDDAAH